MTIPLQVPNPKSIFIFPNPTTGIVHIHAESEIREVGKYNFSGQRLLHLINQDHIDVSKVPQDLYNLLVVFVDGSVHAEKILKD